MCICMRQCIYLHIRNAGSELNIGKHLQKPSYSILCPSRIFAYFKKFHYLQCTHTHTHARAHARANSTFIDYCVRFYHIFDILTYVLSCLIIFISAWIALILSAHVLSRVFVTYCSYSHLIHAKSQYGNLFRIKLK